MLNLKNVLLRIFALFSVEALRLVGAGSLAGVNPYIAALLGGALAVSDVLEGIARAYLDDGKLTKEEFNAEIKKAVNKMKKDNNE